jgi:hypothetical protein
VCTRIDRKPLVRTGSGEGFYDRSGTRNNCGSVGPPCGPRPNTRLCPPMETIDPGNSLRKLPDCNWPRMFRPWFSRSVTALRHFTPSAIRTPATMSAPYATQSYWTLHVRVTSKYPHTTYTTRLFIRSERDERDYRLVRLQNGLQAMLVHDVKADKAAASMDVAVGHLYDPVRYISDPRTVRDALTGH